MKALKITGSWCPECGPNVTVDQDGLCSGCGNTCTGPGAERALLLERRLATLRELIFGKTGRPGKHDEAWERMAWNLTAPVKGAKR